MSVSAYEENARRTSGHVCACVCACACCSEEEDEYYGIAHLRAMEAQAQLESERMAGMQVRLGGKGSVSGTVDGVWG